MVTVDEFSRITARIQTAVLDPQDWTAAMADLRTLFDAQSAAVVVSDGTRRQPRCGDMPVEARSSYTDYYHRVDYVLAEVETGPIGPLHSGAALVGRRDGTEFDAEWLRPHGMASGFFVRLATGGETAVFLVAGNGAGFETPDRAQLFAAFVPHVQQALRIERHLHGRVLHADDAARAADAIQRGLLLLDRDGTVLHANSEAERILDGNDGLARRAGRLHAESADARRRLQTAILAAAGLPIGDPSGGWVACCRPSGRRPYLLHVLPTPAGDCGTLIVLIDLDRRIEPPVEVLRRIYRLTRAESQVAVRVLHGDGLAPIAEELSVSLTTVRTHLQRIFDKTGTHRQAELVRLLLTLSG